MKNKVVTHFLLFAVIYLFGQILGGIKNIAIALEIIWAALFEQSVWLATIDCLEIDNAGDKNQQLFKNNQHNYCLFQSYGVDFTFFLYIPSLVAQFFLLL